MAISKGENITSLEMEELDEKSKTIFFGSNYQFLNEHRGYRPGNMHIFLGTAGGGKSTLVRSLLIDVLPRLKKGKKVLLWLSEETAEEFTIEFGKTGIVKHGRPLLDKLHIFSEQENDMDAKESLCELSRLAMKDEYGFVFIDNITTSEFYMDLKPNVQSMVAKKIKGICQKAYVPFVLIAHTGAEISDSFSRLIVPNDIRGSKSIVNLAPFYYVMQRFLTDDSIYPTLRVCKHRGQIVNKSIFLLRFCQHTVLFKDDRSISFEIFKEAFKNRNTLK